MGIFKRKARGVTIRMFLVDGTPDGLRVVERMGWTGSLLAFSRADYASVRARPEVTQTGVYVLIGKVSTNGEPLHAYVGEAEEVRKRLDSHHKDKDFWTQGFILTTKDNSLNKAHVRYLEARLIGLAGGAGIATLENGTSPEPTNLSEPEEAEMEAFLENALPLFPLVEADVFESANLMQVPQPGIVSHESSPVAGMVASNLYLKQKNVYAKGQDTSKGFLVQEGAFGPAQSRSMTKYYKVLRDQLISAGILVEEGSALHLSKNHIFDSPSAAATVIAGSSRNGRIAWREVGSDKTLKALQAEAASSDS